MEEEDGSKYANGWIKKNRETKEITLIMINDKREKMKKRETENTETNGLINYNNWFQKITSMCLALHIWKHWSKTVCVNLLD